MKPASHLLLHAHLAAAAAAAAAARGEFVYHAGPGKTGTTTIQAAGAARVETLKSDGVRYLGTGFAGHQGKDEIRRLALCASPRRRPPNKTDDDCAGRLARVRAAADAALDAGETVLVSEECETKVIHALVRGVAATTRVRVVVAYRRLLERLPSLYRQLHNLEDAGRYRDWASSPAIPGFPRFFRQSVETSAARGAVVSDAILNGQLDWLAPWRASYERVDVFNFHDLGPDGLAAAFFCRTFPDAARTCAALRAAGARPVANPTSAKKPLVADRLATAARRRGRTAGPRSRVRRAFDAALSARNASLPRFDCLEAAEVDELAERTRLEERTLFPDFFRRRGAAEIAADLERADSERRFCSEDVDAIVETDWARGVAAETWHQRPQKRRRRRRDEGGRGEPVGGGAVELGGG